MQLTLTNRLVARTANDGQAVPFALKCFDDSAEPWTAATPTTLRYRVDDIDTNCNIVPWTSLTPASTATITVTGSQNTLQGAPGMTRRQVVVQADVGLATVCVAHGEYWIHGLAGICA